MTISKQELKKIERRATAKGEKMAKEPPDNARAPVFNPVIEAVLKELGNRLPDLLKQIDKIPRQHVKSLEPTLPGVIKEREI